MFRRKHLLITVLVLITLLISAAAVSARQTEVSTRTQTNSIAGQPMGSPHYELDWNVSANGGGTVTSTHYQVSSTIGQPATGISGSSNFEVCSGFWCKVLAIFEINLPVINRNLTP
jgi:hypothetical protein